MSLDPTLRPAVPADAEALAALAARTFQETFGADNRPEDMADYIQRAYSVRRLSEELCAKDQRIFVAEHDHTLVAFAQLRLGPPPSCVTSPTPIELQRLYLDRPWHGRGLAQRLMARSLAEARALGAGSIWLGVWEHNTKATAFYRRQGFVTVGVHQFVLGEDHQQDLVMVKVPA